MKKLRILFATILLTALGTGFAFADAAAPFYVKAMYWAVYIVPIAIIVIGILILYRTLRNYRGGSRGSDRNKDRD